MQAMEVEASVFRGTKYDMCLYHVFHHHEHIPKRGCRKRTRSGVQASLGITIMKQSRSVDYQPSSYPTVGRDPTIGSDLTRRGDPTVSNDPRIRRDLTIRGDPTVSNDPRRRRDPTVSNDPRIRRDLRIRRDPTVSNDPRIRRDLTLSTYLTVSTNP